MKALKITLAILIPVAIICGVLPVVYPIVAPLEGTEINISDLISQMIDVIKDFSVAKEVYGLAIFIMLVAPIVGALLFVLWIVFGIALRKPIGILWGIIAGFVLVACALGVFIDATLALAAELLEESPTAYKIMQYVAIGAIVLFIAAFVVHVIIMFKARAARKAAKRAKQSSFDSNYEIDMNDLPPVLFEKQAEPDHDPDLFLTRGEHIPVTANRVLKGYYVRDDEIDALLASGTYGAEEEIPESILEFLHSKTRAEERGEYLPIFDPNFVPSRAEEAMYTDEELRVIEALRNYKRKEERVEPVPDSIRRFLDSKPVDKTPDLPILDPNYSPKEKEEEAGLSEEELRVVAAMSQFEPKQEEEPFEDLPFFHGEVRYEKPEPVVEYVDLPFFKEHEEPVEFVEEFIEIVKPEQKVNAPKLENKKPVHISKNKEGKYQLKQVGEEKPLAVFNTEAEAVRYAEGLKKVNGVAVRIHDDEGKIRSL